MREAYFAVTTLIPTSSGFAWWPIEMPFGTTLDDLMARLVADGVVKVTKLDLERGPGPNARTITKRQEAILGIGMVGTILPLTGFDVVEGRR